VSLTDYLDTGLFLDHRPLRARVEREAAGKDVLNLFAYTGSFTVYAASGRAHSTVSVDRSNTYIEWARENMRLNILDTSAHRYVRADVECFLDTDRQRYDLILIDPPTFSNNKTAEAVFDVQLDHGQLLNRALERLKTGGALYFSTNKRQFRLNESEINCDVITDITVETTDDDFRRRPGHRAWRLTRAR